MSLSCELTLCEPAAGREMWSAGGSCRGKSDRKERLGDYHSSRRVSFNTPHSFLERGNCRMAY